MVDHIESAVVSATRKGLEDESDKLNKQACNITKMLVAWYTFFYGFVVGAMAWSVTRCYDEKLDWKSWRPLYITATFNLVQVIIGVLVSYRIRKSLSEIRKRDTRIVKELRKAEPTLPPKSAIWKAYEEGVNLMIVAQSSLFVTIIVLVVMAAARFL